MVVVVGTGGQNYSRKEECDQHGKADAHDLKELRRGVFSVAFKAAATRAIFVVAVIGAILVDLEHPSRCRCWCRCCCPCTSYVCRKWRPIIKWVAPISSVTATNVGAVRGIRKHRRTPPMRVGPCQQTLHFKVHLFESSSLRFKHPAPHTPHTQGASPSH